MLSANVAKGEVDITRAGNPKYMATAVRVHNNSMVGVDLSDRRLASHATESKWVKKMIQKDLLSFTQSISVQLIHYFSKSWKIEKQRETHQGNFWNLFHSWS